MKTYLVTGGAGFIGSNYIHYMFREYGNKIKIINLDFLTYAGNLENLNGVENYNYQFIHGDICNKSILDEIFNKHDIDYIVHFAAETHVDRSIENPEIFIKTNVLGTLTLLNIAKLNWEISDGNYKDDKKFIHISTDEVYGSLGDVGFFTEKTPLNPNSPYSASKASSDLLVKVFFDTYKLPVNITRCSNNYGPYQFPEKLIPLMISNALNGEKLPLYGDGKNIRDWLYVEDHVRAIDIVTKNGILGEIYNIGGNNEKQNIDIINIIIEILNDLLSNSDSRKNAINRDLIKYVPDRKGHDKRYAIDSTKITEQLGWKSSVIFEDGIRTTINWYLENKNWIQNIINGKYKNCTNIN